MMYRCHCYFLYDTYPIRFMAGVLNIMKVFPIQCAPNQYSLGFVFITIQLCGIIECRFWSQNSLIGLILGELINLSKPQFLPFIKWALEYLLRGNDLKSKVGTSEKLVPSFTPFFEPVTLTFRRRDQTCPSGHFKYIPRSTLSIFYYCLYCAIVI